jgi:hypothetical protein
MNKWQKTGFLISAGIFLLLGIIFLLIGHFFNEEALRFMGLVWTPIAILNLVFIIILVKKAK